MLDVYAGNTARKIIQEQGFTQDLFSSFLGASGGPKWFSLFGLDKYLFGEFFKERQASLDLIGSSAGAFRAACFAQSDPVQAISTLAKEYSETTYQDDVTPKDITDSARSLLTVMLGDSGVNEILDNPVFHTHFIVAKAKGWTSSENKYKQMAGLSKSYLLNKMERSNLSKQYERFVFYSGHEPIHIHDTCNFATQYIKLTKENLADALLASGAIPIVMQGIPNIAGAPQGMYRDGGIIDYHFDFALPKSTGLTLYPHFNAQPKAGWFDKNLARKVNPEYYDNTIMLVPSDEFVSKLPFAKIPDRNDFTKMDATTRIKYWKTVLSETERLGEFFANSVHNKHNMSINTIE